MDPVSLTWPGGTDDFALPLDRLRAVQEATNAGPEEVFNRLRLGTWRADDLLVVLREGLIGAGADRGRAAERVRAAVATHPLAAFKLAAAGVLRHALFGPEDDPAGKPEGAETAAPENGSSRKSTAPAP